MSVCDVTYPYTGFCPPSGAFSGSGMFSLDAILKHLDSLVFLRSTLGYMSCRQRSCFGDGVAHTSWRAACLLTYLFIRLCARA